MKKRKPGLINFINPAFSLSEKLNPLVHFCGEYLSFGAIIRFELHSNKIVLVMVCFNLFSIKTGQLNFELPILNQLFTFLVNRDDFDFNQSSHHRWISLKLSQQSFGFQGCATSLNSDFIFKNFERNPQAV